MASDEFIKKYNLSDKDLADLSKATVVQSGAGVLRDGAFCEHGYPLEGPPWPPCRCRPVVCVVCEKQMFYEGDPRHEPESTLSKSGTLNDRYIHNSCIDAPVSDRARKQRELEDEVVDAARVWCWGGTTTSIDNQKLLEAIRALEKHMKQ